MQINKLIIILYPLKFHTQHKAYIKNVDEQPAFIQNNCQHNEKDSRSPKVSSSRRSHKHIVKTSPTAKIINKWLIIIQQKIIPFVSP
jgi:hypothetical protein